MATLPPDLCDGVVFKDVNLEPRWYDANNNFVWGDWHLPAATTCGSNQLSRANAIAFWINQELLPRGIAAAPNLTPNGDEQVIARRTDNGDFAYGAGGITYEYSANLRANRTDGTCDAFSLPTEPASPYTALLAWRTANAPNSVLSDFDTTSANRFFMHFAPLPAGTGSTATGVSLRLDLRAIGGGAFNDRIGLMVNGTSIRWSASILSLLGTGATWNSGQEADICLNLANLPTSTGTVDLMPSVLAAGGVEIYIQDDTQVDCLTVTVQRCQ